MAVRFDQWPAAEEYFERAVLSYGDDVWQNERLFHHLASVARARAGVGRKTGKSAVP